MQLSSLGLSDDAPEEFSQGKHDDIIQYDAFLKTGGVLTGGLRRLDSTLCILSIMAVYLDDVLY